LPTRAGYALFGVLNGTEINPDFNKEVDRAVAAAGGRKDAQLVVYCSQGGSMVCVCVVGGGGKGLQQGPANAAAAALHPQRSAALLPPGRPTRAPLPPLPPPAPAAPPPPLLLLQEPTETSKLGLQTRSLIAAFQLLQRGYTNVRVLRGGYRDWVAQGRCGRLPPLPAPGAGAGTGGCRRSCSSGRPGGAPLRRASPLPLGDALRC
jgi:hypothetical protein